MKEKTTEKEKQGKEEHFHKTEDKADNKAESPEHKIQELTNDLQRLQAEFENFKKRMDKEKTESKEYFLKEFMLKLLPVIDSFEIALKSPACNEGFINGVKLVYAQLYSSLEADGLRKMKTLGEHYDPYKHEVLQQEKGAKDNMITEVYQQGYMLKDKVIRTSKVKISKGDEHAEASTVPKG